MPAFVFICTACKLNIFLSGINSLIIGLKLLKIVTMKRDLSEGWIHGEI